MSQNYLVDAMYEEAAEWVYRYQLAQILHDKAHDFNAKFHDDYMYP